MSGNPVQHINLSAAPKVSVVIPSFSRSREGNLRALVEDLKGQTFKDLEILIVHGVSPQGRAINLGAAEAKGETLVVIDDDARLAHPRVIGNLVNALKADPKIGMAGASILTPQTANRFQKMAAKQFPRFNMPVVNRVTDSDLACHGCVAFPMDVFKRVGMERDNILRGLDPDLRVRIRNAGYRVVLVPDTWAYHPFPESVSRFIRLFVRNGEGSAYIQVFHPELIYDTHEKTGSEGFVPKRSLAFRVARYPFRLLKSILTFQWIRFLGYSVYVFGYAKGWVRYSIEKARANAPS
jgi:GT2 family glycosyltransferase